MEADVRIDGRAYRDHCDVGPRPQLEAADGLVGEAYLRGLVGGVEDGYVDGAVAGRVGVDEHVVVLHTIHRRDDRRGDPSVVRAGLETGLASHDLHSLEASGRDVHVGKVVKGIGP